jgi:hypothetical protein
MSDETHMSRHGVACLDGWQGLKLYDEISQSDM